MLDGVDVDSGTAGEMGFAYGLGKPVHGLRTDFRVTGDNEAAGINLQLRYFIEHPAIADALQAEKLAQAAAFAPDLLLTTNIGCRIHLGNGLRARGTALSLRHPLALLAAQLDNRGHDPA